MNYLHFTVLESQATTTDTSDGCQVWSFPYENTANQLSRALAEMGIRGSTGNNKHVAQHIRNNPYYGVVLTQDNLKKIREIHAQYKTIPNHFNPRQLAQNIKLQMEQLPLLGHYRNSRPSVENFIKALETFANNPNLDETIGASRAHGQGSTSQPDTIKATFGMALEVSIHGGILQTIVAIKNNPQSRKETDLAVALEAAVLALDKVFGDPNAPVAGKIDGMLKKEKASMKVNS